MSSESGNGSFVPDLEVNVIRIANAITQFTDHILDRNILNRLVNAVERIADHLEEQPEVDSRKEIAAVHNDLANQLNSILNETDAFKRAYKLRRLATEAVKTAAEAHHGTQTSEGSQGEAGERSTISGSS